MNRGCLAHCARQPFDFSGIDNPVKPLPARLTRAQISDMLYEKIYAHVLSPQQGAHGDQFAKGGARIMKHIQTLNANSLKDTMKKGGCGECQTSCQSACKTSCTIANQNCENHK